MSCNGISSLSHCNDKIISNKHRSTCTSISFPTGHKRPILNSTTKRTPPQSITAQKHRETQKTPLHCNKDIQKLQHLDDVRASKVKQESSCQEFNAWPKEFNTTTRASSFLSPPPPVIVCEDSTLDGKGIALHRLKSGDERRFICRERVGERQVGEVGGGERGRSRGQLSIRAVQELHLRKVGSPHTVFNTREQRQLCSAVKGGSVISKGKCTCVFAPSSQVRKRPSACSALPSWCCFRCHETQGFGLRSWIRVEPVLFVSSF